MVARTWIDLSAMGRRAAKSPTEAGLGFAGAGRYTTLMTKTATYDAEAQTFTLTGTGWFDTYPIADLRKWIEFYRMLDRDYPKSEGAYLPTIAALEGLAKQLGEGA